MSVQIIGRFETCSRFQINRYDFSNVYNISNVCGGRILQKKLTWRTELCVERNHHGIDEASFIQGRSERAFYSGVAGGECLWNVMCNNYHNRDERDEAKNV